MSLVPRLFTKAAYPSGEVSGERDTLCQICEVVAEGRSLNFTCGEEATALLVDVGEREKLVELQRLSLLKTAANNARN